MKSKGFYYDGSIRNDRMDKEIVKIKVINSEGAKSSAPSIDPIPFFKNRKLPPVYPPARSS
jgi:hypothetical protein